MNWIQSILPKIASVAIGTLSMIFAVGIFWVWKKIDAHTRGFFFSFWKNLNRSTSRRLKRPPSSSSDTMSGAREEQVSFSITEDDVCNISIAYNVILRRPNSGICGLSRSYGLWSQEFLWVWFLKAVLWIFVGTSVHKARALQACFQKLDISTDWHLQSQTFILCWILTSSACFTLDNRLSTAPIVFYPTQALN